MFKYLLKFVKGIIAFVFFGILLLKHTYKTQMEGVVKLKNAPGVATITREEETQIAHIYGDTLEAALYAQGYAHAQTRLWQMQMTRLAAQGRISEFFGEKAINIDKFMRVMEFYSLSEKSVKLFDEKETALYSSYLDGINDYV